MDWEADRGGFRLGLSGNLVPAVRILAASSFESCMASARLKCGSNMSEEHAAELCAKAQQVLCDIYSADTEMLMMLGNYRSKVDMYCLNTIIYE